MLNQTQYLVCGGKPTGEILDGVKYLNSNLGDPKVTLTS